MSVILGLFGIGFVIGIVSGYLIRDWQLSNDDDDRQEEDP